MSQGTPSLAATCWVLAHLCGGAGSQGVIRVRPAELITPKQTKIWPCDGRSPSRLGKKKNDSVLEPHNSVCTRVCLSSAGGSPEDRASNLPRVGGVSQAWGGGNSDPPPQSHITPAVPDPAQTSAGRSHQELGRWSQCIPHAGDALSFKFTRKWGECPHP